MCCKCISIFYLGLLILFSSCSQVTVSTNDSFEGIELPDGSIVLLNRNSSVTYDKNFAPRTIDLTGEAFFNVISNETSFTVTTQLGEVSVIGTKFNVNSTEEELVVEVESGEVELATQSGKKKLSHGQQAHYNNKNKTIRVGKANHEFRKWLKELNIEFKKLGKEIGRTSKKIGKELEKEGKKLNKRIKN